jgi:hypothetical protein
MKIILTTAAPQMGLAQLQTYLHQAGLSQAKPASSPAGQLTPTTWFDKLCVAQGFSDLNAPPAQALPVGKVWEELAVNVFLANIDQAQWGFADERVTWTHDFWAGMDPQIRFVVVYESFAHQLARLQADAELSDDAIQSAANLWLTYHQELIKLVKKSGREVLVLPATEALLYPQRWVYTCAEKWGMKLDWESIEAKSGLLEKEAVRISKLRLKNLGAIKAMQKEWEPLLDTLINPIKTIATTTLPDTKTSSWTLFGAFGKSKALAAELEKVTQDWQTSQTDLSRALEQIQGLESLKTDLGLQIEEHKQEGELLLKQLHQVQEELESQFLKRQDLEKVKADLEKKLKDEESKSKTALEVKAGLESQLKSLQASAPEQAKQIQESTSENVLLLKQLHEVQEELENYYLKNTEQTLQRQVLQDRLDRILLRLPLWSDAQELNAKELVSEKNHRCLEVSIKNLWVNAGLPTPNLRFLVGKKNGVPYMEFRPKDLSPQDLLPWPREHQDNSGERLLIAPSAPGSLGKTLKDVYGSMSTTQWLMVKSLPLMLSNQISRLSSIEKNEHLYWVDTFKLLASLLDSNACPFYYDNAKIIESGLREVNQEFVRVAVNNLLTNNFRAPLIMFDINLDFSNRNRLNFNFKPFKGASIPFVSWKTNANDENGDYFTIGFELNPKDGKLKKINRLNSEDGVTFNALLQISHHLIIKSKRYEKLNSNKWKIFFDQLSIGHK